ncbi:translation initiation factor IF-3 [Iodidimonas gelatinilytica]|uniref:translation initiation factor IF-3 n=1 Tax=Iodidimonas gelatinilytica TaxID=1236966 RepID=UPI0012316937|nr:translation initiation factor IF-3 [Iodidimonas gelatinilytica]
MIGHEAHRLKLRGGKLIRKGRLVGPPPKPTGPRINERIKVPQVRLIGPDGDNHGVVDIDTALQVARQVGLDLVEISPNADPPVCKVLDFGKYKYEAQKKANAAKKKQKTQDIKEIKMRPGIDVHDYQTKMKAMNKFLDAGDKVKVTLRFRGREMAHQDLGMDVLKRVQADIAEIAKVEAHPRMEGRQMTMVVAPK